MRTRRFRNAVFTLEGMRALPARPGAQQRLAQLPEWDGTLRFKQDGFQRIWTDEEIQDAAQEGLYSMAAGACGYTPADCRARENDPNDPPAVKQQILRDYLNSGGKY
jgi:hypothetical protein